MSEITEQMAAVGLTIVSIAELEELRALKRKVEAPQISIDAGWNDCIAWLRKPA